MQEAGGGHSSDESDEGASIRGSEEEGDGKGGSEAYALYRKMVIDDATYERNFKELKGAYWQIQSELRSWYNFGLVVLDC